MTKKRDRQSEPSKTELVGFLGLGLDNTDGEKRFTIADHFFLLGGSHETHTRMQNTAIQFNERLKHYDRRLDEATIEEIIQLFHESCE